MKHFLDKFKFCPVCGSANFNIHNDKSKKCADCGFTYYINPSVATACFIRNSKDELLICTRANEPSKGTFDLPGGFIDMDETLEHGMLREVMEETHLLGKDLHYLFSIPNLYVYSDFPVHTTDVFFELRVKDFSKAVRGDDAASLNIIKIEELNPEVFGLRSIKQAVVLYLKNHKNKF